jgi:hypothetical protein
MQDVMQDRFVANMSGHARQAGGAGLADRSVDPSSGRPHMCGRSSMMTALRRKLLQGACRTLVCGLAALAWPHPSFADDTTNAAKIKDSVVWGQMHQVMGGTSATLPGSNTILGPTGIYAVVQLSSAIMRAQEQQVVGIDDVDYALTNYFGYLLDNQAVSGLLLLTDWSDLNPSDGAYAWNGGGCVAGKNCYLDDAFNAISAWNSAHPSAQKTLQLGASPGFNSPDWLFKKMDAKYGTGASGSGSCDGLFKSPAVEVSSSCGYTTIFYQTENAPRIQMRLPMPWNPTYKAHWRSFLLALNKHIASNPDYVSSFVSIGVGGPTASSTEIILPNGNPGPNNYNLSPPDGTGKLTLPNAVPSVPVLWKEAWTKLLTNNYQTMSSAYVNSDRAFVEEWAAAIDMYGEVFSGITLVVTTGNGLPNFSAPGSPLQDPPPAFAPDCGDAPDMDCAAETAILAHFAEPSVGGANAKSTNQAALKAADAFPPGGAPLTPASVKWLSQITSARVTALPGITPGSYPVVSRMLGGLQLVGPFSTKPSAANWCPTTPCTPEQALHNVLTNYFAGTAVGNNYSAPIATNGSGIVYATVANAPINFLQIWETDILYASGWGPPPIGSCTWQQLMSAPATKGGPPPGCTGGEKPVQQLLNTASKQILEVTAEAVTLPPPNCFVARGAFPGDPVCVSLAEHSQVLAENAAAASNFATNYTNTEIVPNVPYGICTTGLQYRQANMGDYVCVTSTQARQVVCENAGSAGLGLSYCAPPPRCKGSTCF